MGIPSDEEYQAYQRLSDSRNNTTQSTPLPTTSSSLYELPTTYPLTTPTFPVTHMLTQQIMIPPDFPFFSSNAGDSHTVQPLQWLRRYENIFPARTKDTDAILIFDHVWDPESPVEEWYEEFTMVRRKRKRCGATSLPFSTTRRKRKVGGATSARKSADLGIFGKKGNRVARPQKSAKYSLFLCVPAQIK